MFVVLSNTQQIVSDVEDTTVLAYVSSTSESAINICRARCVGVMWFELMHTHVSSCCSASRLGLWFMHFVLVYN